MRRNFFSQAPTVNGLSTAQISAAEQGKKKQSKKRISFSSFLNLGLRSDKEYLMENLALLVSSGMTVLEAVETIREDVRSKRMQRLLEHVKQGIEDGIPLSALFEETRLFPVSAISLIRIGEETGNLSKNLNVIRLQQEKDRMFTSKIRSAMLYPVFVLVLTFVIGVGTAWFILPKLAMVFNQLRLDLPLITRILIALGTYLDRYGNIVVPGILGVSSLLFYFIFFFPRTKIVGEAILFLIPGVRRLIREVELARFGYVLGTLLESGFSVTRSVEVVAETTPLWRYKKLYMALALSLDEGNSFQKSFMGYRNIKVLIPKPAQQLIVTGEKSGNLPETLLILSRNYEERTETMTKNLSVILEPVLLVIVWLGVLGVALAVILPIYSLIGGLNSETQPVVIEETSQIDSPSATIAEPAVVPGTEVVQPILKLEIHSPDLDYLNVRESPSLKGKIIDRVNDGERYEYTNVENGWYFIVLPEQRSGWVSGRFIILIDTSSNE